MNFANPSFPSPSAESSLPGRNETTGTPMQPQGEHHSAAAEMMTRVVTGAHETIDHIAQRATPSLEQLEAGLNQTGESLHGQAEQWRATADEWADSLRGTVRENPLAALAAALAVGVVIARLAR